MSALRAQRQEAPSRLRRRGANGTMGLGPRMRRAPESPRGARLSRRACRGIGPSRGSRRGGGRRSFAGDRVCIICRRHASRESARRHAARARRARRSRPGRSRRHARHPRSARSPSHNHANLVIARTQRARPRRQNHRSSRCWQERCTRNGCRHTGAKRSRGSAGRCRAGGRTSRRTGAGSERGRGCAVRLGGDCAGVAFLRVPPSEGCRAPARARRAFPPTRLRSSSTRRRIASSQPSRRSPKRSGRTGRS